MPAIVREVLRSPGQPLATPSRVLMESRFGRDFSGVRVHTDTRASASARAVRALAYTVGTDIVLGAGSHAPPGEGGRGLLAHELAHVAQQGASSRQAPTRDLRIAPADDRWEAEAKQASGALAGPPRLSGRSPALQRISVGEWFSRFFLGGGTFPEEELQAYLDFLDRERRIEDAYDSDNKAREVVARWRAGDSRYILPARRKILLIREMQSGFTGNADERAILALLRGSSAEEFAVILSAIGESNLLEDFQGDERDELVALLRGQRTPGAQGDGAPGAARRETFPGETALEAQRRFTSNAELERHVRRNCIEIVRAMVPLLLAQDPQLAERAGARLARLRGPTLTMEHAMVELVRLGAAVGPTDIKFDNGNGNLGAPNEMLGSAWDTIIGQVGDVRGWHIFGLAVFDGYHSVTVFVDNRPDGPRLYWADQWALEGEDFGQASGSVSGFRRYERGGFDSFITTKTREWWNGVHSPTSKCGERNPRDWDRKCRYDTTLKIWKLQSARAPAGGTP